MNRYLLGAVIANTAMAAGFLIASAFTGYERWVVDVASGFAVAALAWAAAFLWSAVSLLRRKGAEDRGSWRRAVADQAGIAGAAEYFCETWAELAGLLADEYGCTMNCGEANALADLFTACGYPEKAAQVITDHARHDTGEDQHYDEAAKEDQGA